MPHRYHSGQTLLLRLTTTITIAFRHIISSNALLPLHHQVKPMIVIKSHSTPISITTARKFIYIMTPLSPPPLPHHYHHVLQSFPHATVTASRGFKDISITVSLLHNTSLNINNSFLTSVTVSQISLRIESPLQNEYRNVSSSKRLSERQKIPDVQVSRKWREGRDGETVVRVINFNK